MQSTEPFGRLVRVEAERRGLSQATTVLSIGDGGNWIDPLVERERLYDHRIVDYYHAAEHLYEAARAAMSDGTAKPSSDSAAPRHDRARPPDLEGKPSPAEARPAEASPADALAEELTTHLWNGRVDAVIAILQHHAERWGPVQANDGPDHPRRVLANNVGYFTRHRRHMDYPAYRRKGWPIGSGITESGVKQFNKRVKGSDQFWNTTGAECILALRALWLSQDDRWTRHWNTRPAYPKAA
jgi:hypothetical protein